MKIATNLKRFSVVTAALGVAAGLAAVPAMANPAPAANGGIRIATTAAHPGQVMQARDRDRRGFDRDRGHEDRNWDRHDRDYWRHHHVQDYYSGPGYYSGPDYYYGPDYYTPGLNIVVPLHF